MSNLNDLPSDLRPDWHTGPRLYSLAPDVSSQHPEVIKSLLVERFAYSEHLSEGFVIELHVLSSDAKLSIRSLMNEPVQLRARLADGRIHGRGSLVTAVSRLGSDGGFTRFRLILQPWVVRLQQRRHSRVWQNKTAREIVDDILSGYQPLAGWKWGEVEERIDEHLANGPQNGVLNYFVQYRESDWQTLQRLLALVGMGWRVEPVPEDAPPGGFGHQAVFFAHSHLVPEDETSKASAGGAGIRFHRAGPTEAQDTLCALASQRQLAPWGSTELRWDHRVKRAVTAEARSQAVSASTNFSAMAPWLQGFHHAHAPADGEALTQDSLSHQAAWRQDALDARVKSWMGLGTVRSFRAGQWFSVTEFEQAGMSPGETQEAKDARRQFLVVAVQGVAINNLPTNQGAELKPARFTHPWLQGTMEDKALLALAKSNGHGARIQAQRRAVAWRPLAAQGPTVSGTQTAIVVGPTGNTLPEDGKEIHTDATGRIRIRFHWQSGPLSDPRADNRSSCWVRVCHRGAGPGMGLQRTPRIGDEVVVGFLNSQADCPVVLGSVPNGQGEAGVPATPGGMSRAADRSALSGSSDHTPSAQGNLSSNGRAPAWHGGASGVASPGSEAQNNMAALSGFKSNEWNAQGFNQLVWDDTPQQSRTQLSTTQQATQLNLGHLLHQADNHRGSFRGVGFELRTDAFGAVRAQQGLLLSTYPAQLVQGVPASPAFDNAPGMALMKQALSLAESLSTAAQAHRTTTLASVRGSQRGNWSPLNDQAAPLKALSVSVSGTADATSLEDARKDAKQHCVDAGQGRLPHMADPLVATSAKGNLALLAGQHLQWASSDTISLQSGRDFHCAVGSQMRWHSNQAIGLLAGAYRSGSTAALGSGITAINDKGPIDAQAQSGPIKLSARDQLRVQSASAHVDWAAAKRVTVKTAGGAQITIDASGVSSQCPGTMTFYTSRREMVGPANVSYVLPTLPGKDTS